MAINFSLSGAKGSRKVIKTIDVNDESYDALKSIIEGGEGLPEDLSELTIYDTYKIFGGNCYNNLVSMAIDRVICSTIHELANLNMLITDVDTALDKMSEGLLPTMCFVSYGEGYGEGLRFFCQNTDDVLAVISECLVTSKAEWFKDTFLNAVKKNERPAGEVALGILLYIISDSE